MSRISRNKQVISLWKEGWPSTKIAAKLKISRNTVMGVVHRARGAGVDLERRIPEPPPPEVKRMPKKPLNTTLNPPRKVSAPVEQKSAEVIQILLPLPMPPAKKGKPKSILELGTFDCRWIVSKGKYCGERAESARTPWCPDHYKMVYVPASKTRKI